MTFFYTLITSCAPYFAPDGGYMVESHDGQVRFIQDFNPDLPDYQPYTPEEAKAAAEAKMAEFEAIFNQ
jgi:hypothetical protein